MPKWFSHCIGGIILAKGKLATIHYDSAPRPQKSCFANPNVDTVHAKYRNIRHSCCHFQMFNEFNFQDFVFLKNWFPSLKTFFSSHFNCSIQVQFSPKTRKSECTLKECCRKLFSIHFLDKIGQKLKSFICNTSYSTVILTRPSSSNTIRQVHCVNNSYSIVKDSSAELGVIFKILQNRPNCLSQLMSQLHLHLAFVTRE